MRGHLPIIEMRRAGKRPSFVFINDWLCPTDWAKHGDHATVSVAGDRIQTLDLRFLVGLRVSITSHDEQRARALFEAAKAHGAQAVGAGVVDPTREAWDQHGWAEVWHG